MYNKHFGFKERPFKLLPNPAYLYASPSHEEALAHLAYAVSEGDGFIAITGEAGTGKTTLCRAFIEKLDDRIEVAYVFNPKLSSFDLLKTVCDEFGITVPSKCTLKDLIDAFNRFLFEKKMEDKHVMLIIDEAQNLSRNVLEQIRLLSNLETSKEKLFQIVLVGQPELNDLLETHELRQLQQRITLNCRLAPLTFEETVKYIRHRIKIAAQKETPLFTGPALEKIYEFSKGVPRLIHIVCNRSLLSAFVSNREKVSGAIVDAVIQELRPTRKIINRRKEIGTPKMVLAGSLLCFVAFLLFVIWPTSSRTTTKTSAQTTPSSSTLSSNNTLAETTTASDTPVDGSSPEINNANTIEQDTFESAPLPESSGKTVILASATVPVMDSAPGAGPGIPVNFFTEPAKASAEPIVSEFAPSFPKAESKTVPAVADSGAKSSSEPIQEPKSPHMPSASPSENIDRPEQQEDESPLAQATEKSEGINKSTSAADGKTTKPAKATPKPDAEPAPSSLKPDSKAVLASAADSDTKPTPEPTRKPKSSDMPSASISASSDRQEEQEDERPSAQATEKSEGIDKSTSAADGKTTTPTKAAPDVPESAPSSSEPESKAVLASAADSDTKPTPEPNPKSIEEPSDVNVLPEKQTAPEQKVADISEVLHAASVPREESLPPSVGAVGNSDISTASTLANNEVIPKSTYEPNEVDQKPKLLSADSPSYPPLAKQNNIKGWVVLQFIVDTKGRTKNAEVLEASPKGIFDDVALAAVESYKFKPAKKDGDKVSCLLKQRIRFEFD